MAEGLEGGNFGANWEEKGWGKGEGLQGVTLTQTAYKVYATMLAERLREEIERKEILLPSQTSFRKGLETG